MVDQESSRSETWRAVSWAMVLLTLFAFALRLYSLGGAEFWLDEAISATISGMGWKGAMAYVLAAPWEHPPFYYLSLYPWQVLAGTSEFALRFYSAFLGVLFIPLIYILVKRLANERLGFLAALLATLSPFMISHSQEARMYTLLPTLALLAVLSFWNALRRERQRFWWLAYLAFMLIGILTHYYFALIWVATTLFLLLESVRRHRIQLVAVAVQSTFLVLVAVWLVLAPGVRESVMSLGQTEFDYGIDYKIATIVPDLILGETTGGEVPAAVSALAIVGWLLAVLGAWWSRRARLLDRQGWLLLMLLLVVPLAGSLFLPYAKGRHLAYTLVPVFIFMASGFVALWRRGRLGLVLGIVAVLLFASYGLAAHYSNANGNLRQAMAYLDSRGEPGDVLILTQPIQKPLITYYNDQNWPVFYLPSIASPPTAEEVDATLSSLAKKYDRVWLGPVGPWTADPDFLVQRWLSTHAFQADKVWFPDSTSVTLYVTSQRGLSPVSIGNISWGKDIRLLDLEAGSLQVAPGEPLRLHFLWQAGPTIGQRYELGLQLVDERGFVWAEQRGEPCGGWCSTDTWQIGTLHVDDHALVVPPGTPPGTYSLQVAWFPLSGETALQADANGQHVERARLASVIVHPSRSIQEHWDLPNPLHVSFSDQIALLGYEPAAFQVQRGGSLDLETHWLAESRPSADFSLDVELVDGQGETVASWVEPVSSAAYPTSAWRAGEYLRGQALLPLPGSLLPGQYSLRIALVGPDGQPLAPGGQASPPAYVSEQGLVLGSVQILDRPRQFDLPPISVPLEATIGRQAHLRGYDLDLSQAQPGGQIDLTLYWQASGPMVLPYKVFTHLTDEAHNIQAQDDSPPGGGCCPANTWAEGEVIVDEHRIPLGAGLAPGAYHLEVGMYDESSSTRLNAYDAAGDLLPGSRIELQPVVLEAPSQSAQGEPSPTPVQEQPEPALSSSHTIFLPIVRKRALSW